MKTSELTGSALDWAVDIANGLKLTVYVDALLGGEVMEGAWVSGYHPNPNRWVKIGSEDHKRLSCASTDWAQGGPIIERERIETIIWKDGWSAAYWGKGGSSYQQDGPTPLIAATRCFVASRLGDEVDVPEELT